MKLTIQRKDPDIPALTAHDLDVYLDNLKLDTLEFLELTVGTYRANKVILELGIDDLDIDVDAIHQLRANLNES